MTPIPYNDFGGVGPDLHFLHANGYPPDCYQPFLKALKTKYHVFGMLLRPLWEKASPSDLDDWRPLSQDLLEFLSQRDAGPLIGVGHSIGAVVTLRAALWQPNRFRALILIEPVLFPPAFILTWNIIRALGLGYKLHPLIPAARHRRSKFDDLELLFKGYRRKDVFRFMSDENLHAYIDGISMPRPDGGFELAYTPEWEARIYETGVWRDLDLWRGLPTLTIPTLIIRGGQTDTFRVGAAQRIQRLRPQTTILTIPESTHLVPLEKPQETFQIMQDFLKEIL
jgi:pimeloyl-ACP methyl ester carboxylesterase